MPRRKETDDVDIVRRVGHRRHLRRLVLALGLVPALAGLAVAVSSSGEAKASAEAGQGAFLTHCRFSHRNTDDVIVYPGEPGESHDHTYFGNTSTNASSTLESLRASGTTCRRQGHSASYWVPTLFVHGQPVDPLGAAIYYRARTSGTVEPFPEGLRMIAGNAAASLPQSITVTFWHCGMGSGVPRSSVVPSCPGAGGHTLRLEVLFPNCWDGVHLDSNDHKSHMAYSRGARCPASHPVVVPAISLTVRYPIIDPSGVELASGGQNSAHADFFNAWDPTELARLVSGCLNAGIRCGKGG